MMISELVWTFHHCFYFFILSSLFIYLSIHSFKNIFYWLFYYSCPNFFSPLFPSALYPHLSSCPWVIHINSLASPFPILFLTSLCLFCTYNLCFLFPVPFPLFSPFPFPADNPPCDLHFCESVPVLVVCLVHFCFIKKVWLLIIVSLLLFYCS